MRPNGQGGEGSCSSPFPPNHQGKERRETKMRGLYELKRAGDNNYVIITKNVDELGIKIGDVEGVQVGSNYMPVNIAETTPISIPSTPNGVMIKGRERK